MKHLLLFTLALFLTSSLFARKVAVTLTTDDLTTPTVGMLRYCINNAQKNDTIIFNVGTVNLLGEISFADEGSDKSIVIDGQDAKERSINGGQNGRILSISSYSSKIAIKNLTFKNGKLSKDLAMGGALYIYKGFSSSVNVEKCIFTDNEVAVIGSNGDGQGGAIRTNGGVFNNCIFQNNKVTGVSSILGGGAVTAIGGVFTNCVFMNNSAKYGGAIYAASGVVLNNCTITDNHCAEADKGAGISNEGATLTNCIIYNNTSNSTNDNIKNYNGSYSHCAIETGNALVGTNNNIGLSATPFKSGVTPYNLSLESGSNCINGGTSNGITVLDKDILGNTRISAGIIDIGAYEDIISTSLHSGQLLNQVILYPNLATSSITISELGSLEGNQNVTISIIDVLGNVLVVKEVEPTINSLSIDVSAFKKGIYFINIQTSNGSVVKRFVKE